MKFYICEHCGNIITKLNDSGVNVVCCNEKMKELIPGVSDGASEKHVPIVTVNGKDVVINVGAIDHPMIDAHYIQWVVIETTKGMHKINLRPNEAPKASFRLNTDEDFVCAYEYCNLHGLWKSN